VKIEIDVMRLVHANVRGVVMGESVPQVFLPRLVELYRQGRFPIDRLIRTYSLPEINQAMADSESGAAVKPVILTKATLPREKGSRS
jgi:aryl-alcohol dehydrogenase